jgi:hypothetical protein
MSSDSKLTNTAKPICADKTVGSNVRFGSKGDLTAPKSNFRSTSESGLKSDTAPCPFRANNGSGAFLFKDLIRAGEKGRRDFDAKRFRGLEINSKQVLGGLFNR